ncbi:MAG: Rne/Rng family ribonuclease [Gammaproteobacteria bacterium]|nr:MAG: Rne/Rng family ribonuclease [Gammaproteobacteria bacterium]UTW43870.1 Rne/Rng family ribonuclease [bacterium SCSIO 12844]
MKKMLINARQPEEVRIATTENGKLLNIDIESIDYEQKKANIYKGIVTRVEPSLNAAFISYGEKRNGFLPFKEIAPEYFKKQVKEGQDIPLTELLDVGQEIIVQINKEERGTKGAALSTYITLAGCYLVLMPNNPEAGGISRRIEGNERQKLKELFDSLDIPKGMGVIIRTAGVDRQVEEMQWDLSVLLKLWSAINQAYKSAPGPFLIHSESDITVRAIRDHLKDDIEEIIVDSEEAGETLKRQLSLLRPDFVERVKIYNDTIPLFSKEQIESRIEEAYKREVILPSGGSIVIDAAEALTAIDINSAKATRGDNIEETAYFTNLEAAEEIARQLRLRDIGGLIVVDFIDMQENEHQRNVEHALIDQLAKDRAKVQMTRISRFGLVEISRQRLQSSLGESATISCPRCEGQGIIRSVPSLALSILRLIKEEAHKEKTNEIRVQLPISVATYLLNEKRDAVKDIESELDFKLVLIPNPNLETPHYYIQRIWGDNYVANKSSYNLIEERKEDSENYIKPKKTKAQQPLVKSMTVEAAPKAQAKQKSGLFKKIWNSIFTTSEEVAEKPKASKAHSSKKPAQKQQGQQKKRTQHQQRHHGQQKQDRDHSKDRRKSQQYGGSKGRGQKSNQTDGDRRSHSARSNQRNNTRPNLYKSEDVVDVQIASTSQPEQKVSNKDQSKDVATKAKSKSKSKQTVITSADALVDSLNVAPLKFETTSKLIKDPKSRISSNVEQILKSSDSQSSMQQIETQSTSNKVKYLKFEYVDLAQLKREQLEKEEKAKIAKREAQEAKREAVKAKKAYDEAQKLKAEEEQAQKYQKTDVKATEAVAIEDKAKQQDQATQQTAAIQSEEQKQMAVTSESFAKADENSEAVISIDVSENVSEFDSEVEIVIDYPEDKLEQSQVEEQELVVQASSESLEEERVEASDIDDHAEVEIVETDSTDIADDEKTEIQSAVEESIEVTEEEHLEEDDEEPVVPAPQIQAEIIEQVTIETKPQIVIGHEVNDQRDGETTVSIEVSKTDVEEDTQEAVEETSNEASSVIEEKDLEQEEPQKLETEHVMVEEVKKEDKEHHDAKSKKDEASASKKRKPQQQRRGGGQKKHHRGGTQQAKGHSNQQNKKHSDDDASSKKSSHHKKDSNKEHQQKKAKPHHKKQHDENKHSSTKDNQSNTKKEEKEES